MKSYSIFSWGQRGTWTLLWIQLLNWCIWNVDYVMYIMVVILYQVKQLIPYELSERNKLSRLSICSKNFTNHDKLHFLYRILICDDKLVLYNYIYCQDIEMNEKLQIQRTWIVYCKKLSLSHDNLRPHLSWMIVT